MWVHGLVAETTGHRDVSSQAWLPPAPSRPGLWVALTALGHTDVRVGVEEDVALGTEAALLQPRALWALHPARRGGQSWDAPSMRTARRGRRAWAWGGPAALDVPVGQDWRSGWGTGPLEIWVWGSWLLLLSLPSCSQTLQHVPAVPTGWPVLTWSRKTQAAWGRRAGTPSQVCR